MTLSTQADVGRLKAPLIEKLARFVELTSDERECLSTLQGDFFRIHDGIDIITAGNAYRSIFVLNRGMAIRYKVLHDGRRQILNLVLPGDFMGIPGCLFSHSLYSVASLGESIACSIAFADIFTLFQRHPRLSAAMFWLVGHDAALFGEHLVGVGRQSAYERVAHLLLELLTRLQLAGLADERSFTMPMTQELMADALGLSVPHVNRTLRRLREDGLIAMDGARFTCLNLPALSRLADFDRANLTDYKIPGL
jgi:CRP-like cAMP-binding protein